MSKQHLEVTITQDEPGSELNWTFCNTCDKLLGDATPWWMAQEKRQAHILWHHGNTNVRAIA